MLGSQTSLTQSKQLYHLVLDGADCQLAAADKALQPFIDYYWLLSILQQRFTLEVIPDTAIDLVLSPDIPNFAALYFPVAKRFSIDLEGPIHYAGICFHSAKAADLLRMEFNQLTQLEIGSDTAQSLHIKPLLADIQSLDSIDTLAERFDRFWLAQLQQIDTEKSSKVRINHQQLINAIESSVGSDSIATICDVLGVSERQFRRLSNDLFGLSPKKLQNILRLQAGLEELFACEPSQIRDLYYDDSHRIKELKRLTGCTPNQIRKMAEKYNNV